MAKVRKKAKAERVRPTSQESRKVELNAVGVQLVKDRMEYEASLETVTRACRKLLKGGDASGVVEEDVRDVLTGMGLLRHRSTKVTHHGQEFDTWG